MTAWVIDTAGIEAVADTIASQIVAVQLRAFELRDSPLQRQNALFGQLYGDTIYIDTRLMGLLTNGTSYVGTPLADTEDYVLQGLTNTVAQLTRRRGRGLADLRPVRRVAAGISDRHLRRLV